MFDFGPVALSAAPTSFTIGLSSTQTSQVTLRPTLVLYDVDGSFQRGFAVISVKRYNPRSSESLVYDAVTLDAGVQSYSMRPITVSYPNDRRITVHFQVRGSNGTATVRPALYLNSAAGLTPIFKDNNFQPVSPFTSGVLKGYATVDSFGQFEMSWSVLFADYVKLVTLPAVLGTSLQTQVMTPTGAVSALGPSGRFIILAVGSNEASSSTHLLGFLECSLFPSFQCASFSDLPNADANLLVASTDYSTISPAPYHAEFLLQGYDLPPGARVWISLGQMGSSNAEQIPTVGFELPILPLIRLFTGASIASMVLLFVIFVASVVALGLQCRRGGAPSRSGAVEMANPVHKA